MKLIKFLILILLLTGFSQQTQAQFFKKLAKHAQKKVKTEAERRAERRVDKGIDKGFDETENTIDGKNKKNSKKKKGKKTHEQAGETGKETGSKAKKSKTLKKNTPKLIWRKFDFVPGDTVIFEDGPAADEENGEFPSRWDLYEGVCEIAEFGGEPIIMFPKRYSSIIPYLKNSKEDYLPEVFTIEFDCYFKKGESSTAYKLNLYDAKNQSRNKNSGIRIEQNQIIVGNSTGTTKDDNIKDDNNESFWRHVSIAFTKGKLKVYLDNQRLVNIPHYEANPTGITISGRGNYNTQSYFIKNIRIAKGGVKYYKRVLSDGKIIVNGIKFDVNKATLKPESMGPINRIYKLMKKQPGLKFSVEGHTDSDGDDAFNMKLSKARAKTVMNKLIAMGIAKSRLKYTGYGESKPIDNNSTPEGKANNRRVEFVKF